MAVVELDGRDRALLSALSERPEPVSELYARMSGGRRPNRSLRAKLSRRLERLEGDHGVQSVMVEGRRYWCRNGAGVFTVLPEPNDLGAAGVCKAGGKWGYLSEQDALAALRLIRGAMSGAGKRAKRPRRAYECPWCFTWHLTSKEERA